MSTSHFGSGLQSVRRRPRLIALFFFANLLLSLLVVMPFTLALTRLVAQSGYGSDLAAEFDLSLWADIIRDGNAAWSAVFGMFFRIIPLLLLWKVASSVGLVHALGMGGGRSFWQGVGRWTGRGLLIAVFYLLGVIVIVVGIVVVGLILNAVLAGEQGMFWIPWIISPILAVLGLAVLDLMHDYARIELVLGNKGSVKAALSGLTWPFKSITALGIYFGWFLVSLLVLAISAWLDLSLSGLWSIFLLQQVFLLARSGVTIAWFGSEVSLYEAVQSRHAPLIAADASGASHVSPTKKRGPEDIRPALYAEDGDPAPPTTI